MQEPCKILEKEAFKICLEREVTSKHTDNWEDGSRQGQPTCAKLAARRSRAAWRAHGEQGAHPAELWPRGRCGRREARKGRLWPDRERINAGLRIWATTVYEL